MKWFLRGWGVQALQYWSHSDPCCHRLWCCHECGHLWVSYIMHHCAVLDSNQDWSGAAPCPAPSCSAGQRWWACWPPWPTAWPPPTQCWWPPPPGPWSPPTWWPCTRGSLCPGSWPSPPTPGPCSWPALTWCPAWAAPSWWWPSSCRASSPARAPTCCPASGASSLSRGSSSWHSRQSRVNILTLIYDKSFAGKHWMLNRTTSSFCCIVLEKSVSRETVIARQKKQLILFSICRFSKMQKWCENRYQTHPWLADFRESSHITRNLTTQKSF